MFSEATIIIRLFTRFLITSMVKELQRRKKRKKDGNKIDTGRIVTVSILIFPRRLLFPISSKKNSPIFVGFRLELFVRRVYTGCSSFSLETFSRDVRSPAVERRSRANPSTRIRRFFVELASNRHAEKLQRISRPAVIYAARVHDIPTLYGARHPLNVKWERGHSPGNVLDFPSLRCIRREFFHLAASRWLPTVLRPWAYGTSYKTALPRRNARKLAK